MKHGYIVTDGLSFVQTFLEQAYESKQDCFYAAVSIVILRETIWGHNTYRTQRGRIVRKAGIIRQQSVGQPVHKVQRNFL